MTDPRELQYRCNSVKDGFCRCGNAVNIDGMYLCGNKFGFYAPDYRKERCGFAEKIEKQITIWDKEGKYDNDG